jgi:GTP:adenosylcobinamide-phosphate guanylyltransferase
MTEPKVLAIIQARMSSSRLPGKVLRDLGGKPMLERVISRGSRARHINGLVGATTVDSTDDPIADFCAQHGTPVFRGSLYDVMDRYYQCALQNGADVIVRITADCPLIDPQEIDRVIAAILEGDCDFAANRCPRRKSAPARLEWTPRCAVLPRWNKPGRMLPKSLNASTSCPTCTTRLGASGCAWWRPPGHGEPALYRGYRGRFAGCPGDLRRFWRMMTNQPG